MIQSVEEIEKMFWFLFLKTMRMISKEKKNTNLVNIICFYFRFWELSVFHVWEIENKREGNGTNKKGRKKINLKLVE